MKLPYLGSWDNTPVTVTLTEDGVGENGVADVLKVYEGYCCFTSKTSTVRSADGQLVNLGGLLTIKGDIAPNIPYLAGEANINGKIRVILNGAKVSNPDGSINHTRLELL